MSNKISVLIDVTVDKANTALGNFKKSIQDADGAANKFQAGAASVGSSIKANLAPAALAGGAALVAFGAKAVDAASDLGESMNAVNVTFKGAADGIHDLGETSVESFGLSQRAFNEAAVQFSSFAKTVAGPGGDVAATMEDLVGRATDFASVMNIDMADAMALFQSSLAGESEPMRRYGKDLSAAAVELYALEKGLVASKSEMTEAIKVQARYGLLMESTADTAGDFANTQDGLANQSKILKAQMEDLSAQVGERLAPAVAGAVGQLTDLLAVAEKLKILDLAAAMQEWMNPLETGKKIMGAVRGENDLLGNSIRVTTQAAWDYAEAQEELGHSFDEALESYEARTKAEFEAANATRAAINLTEEQTEAAREASRVIDDYTESQDLVTDAINEAKAALDAETDAIHRVNDARKTGIDRIYDAREAERQWWETVQQASAVLDDSTAGALEKSAALDAVALSTAEATAKQLAAQGVDIASVTGQKQYLDALKATAAGLSGPMRDAVLEYIALLEGIPAEKVTTIRIRSAATGPGIDAKDNPRYAGATGGIVTRPTYALIGERGPEAVVPLNTAPGASPLGGSGTAGMGGNTYINVNVNDSNALQIANEIARKQRFQR